jgi:hypothetical protein
MPGLPYKIGPLTAHPSLSVNTPKIDKKKPKGVELLLNDGVIFET